MNLSTQYLIAKCQFDMSQRDNGWYQTISELDHLIPRVNPGGFFRVQKGISFPYWARLREGDEFLSRDQSDFCRVIFRGSCHKGEVKVYADRMVVHIWTDPKAKTWYTSEGVEFTVYYSGGGHESSK